MNALPQENGDYFALDPLKPLELERGERLLYRLTEFGRILWEVGIDVGPRKMLDLAETLNYVDITNKEDFYTTLKCSLLAKHEQEAVFDQMYLYYWYMRNQIGKKKADAPGAAKRDEKQMRLPPSERKRLAEHLKNPLQLSLKCDPLLSKTLREKYESVMPGQHLNKKHWNTLLLTGQLTWDEVQDAKKLMAEMRWHLGMRPTRRKRPARRGSYPDMRRIVRRNL